MIKSFRHNGLEVLFLTGKTTGIRPDHAKRLRVILALLNRVTHVGELASSPGLRCHPLKGALKGFYGVDVSGNWRVIFRFSGQDVMDVDYLDYH